MPATTSSSLSLRRAAIATGAPWLASSRATSAPIPVLPPVIRTTLFWIPCFMTTPVGDLVDESGELLHQQGCRFRRRCRVLAGDEQAVAHHVRTPVRAAR